MCIQLDLKEAFNGIDRRAAHRIMCECDPSFAASQATWIGHADPRLQLPEPGQARGPSG